MESNKNKEYATPVWMFQLSVTAAKTLEQLQASLVRQILTRRNGSAPDWNMSKENLFSFSLCAGEGTSLDLHISTTLFMNSLSC